MPKTLLRTIKNVRMPDREGLWQIDIEDGVVRQILSQPHNDEQGDHILDGEGGLAIPPFIEPLSISTPLKPPVASVESVRYVVRRHRAMGGTQGAAVHEDVKQRAWQTLKWQIANGIQHVRTHVDVSDPTLTALKAMLEVKAEVAPWVTLQIVAFPQEGLCRTPTAKPCSKKP